MQIFSITFAFVWFNIIIRQSHLTPSTSRSSRTQLTSRCPCDLSAPRPAAARRPPIFSRCGRQSLWRRGGGWSAAAEYEPKYCLNKISGNFRIQIFFMFHVNLHVQHRNHIFTIMSGTSRAMQKSIFKCDRTQPIQHRHKLNGLCMKTIKIQDTFASKYFTSTSISDIATISSQAWAAFHEQCNHTCTQMR